MIIAYESILLFQIPCSCPLLQSMPNSHILSQSSIVYQLSGGPFCSRGQSQCCKFIKTQYSFITAANVCPVCCLLGVNKARKNCDGLTDGQTGRDSSLNKDFGPQSRRIGLINSMPQSTTWATATFRQAKAGISPTTSF